MQTNQSEAMLQANASWPSVTEYLNQGSVSLTYFSILKEGFTPMFSATLEMEKERFTIRQLA